MFGRNIFEIVIVLALALLLFGGRGKISNVMGDMAKGIKSFRKGLKDGEEQESAAVAPPPALASQPINVTPEKDKTKA